MTVQDISVDLQEREIVGKGLRKLRNNGLIPAVIHDHGHSSIHVMGDYIKLHKTYEQAGKHHPVQLSVGGKHHLALIKDIDFEPTKHRMRHIVFQAIKQNEKVEAEVPIVFKDVEIPAEKISLLILKQLDHVEVEALPKDLPDKLIVDPSKLAQVGDHLTVADLPIPAGVTILTEPETQIAIVEMPKDQIAVADASQASLVEDATKSGNEVEPTVEPTDTTEAKGTDSKEDNK
ncbi:50S ribosomal protein L25 [Candidatus Saccharibacteria bacterium]|nr:50S ribosomal protein L25 [Candidatus Saccharibacteria bacterium]MBI3338364.1 50S ribosomal protein L25 [Candidatus Saccharibacteria bacterium]